MFAGLVFFSGLHSKTIFRPKSKIYVFEFHIKFPSGVHRHKQHKQTILNAYLLVIINDALMKQVRFPSHFIINYLHLFYLI